MGGGIEYRSGSKPPANSDDFPLEPALKDLEPQLSGERSKIKREYLWERTSER